MDRCRCDDYAAAVKKLRFYTVGTYRPDIIDNFNSKHRRKYQVLWIKNSVDLTDFRVERPRALKILRNEELPENQLPKEIRKIEQMWCPFMTPYVLKN